MRTSRSRQWYVRGFVSGEGGPPIGVEEAAKTAGGRGDRWGVGEGLTGEDGQEGIRRLGQSGVAGAGMGAGQGAAGRQ